MKIRYTVRLYSTGAEMEYSRDSYGTMTVAALLEECKAGLAAFSPVVGHSISIHIDTRRADI